MTNRPRESSKTLGEAMRASLHAAHQAECSDAELRILTAVIIHTASWGKLADRASTGQVAVTAGLWDGDPKECPRWLRSKIGTRLAALADAGAITYSPGGGGGWQASQLGLPGSPLTDDPGSPRAGDDASPLTGDPASPPTGDPGSPRAVTEGHPVELRRVTSDGAPPRGYPRGSPSARARPRPREALRSALRAALAPAQRGDDGWAGDTPLDTIIDTCLDHMTSDQLVELIHEPETDDDLLTPHQWWTHIATFGPGDTSWAHELAQEAR